MEEILGRRCVAAPPMAFDHARENQARRWRIASEVHRAARGLVRIEGFPTQPQAFVIVAAVPGQFGKVQLIGAPVLGIGFEQAAQRGLQLGAVRSASNMASRANQNGSRS